MKVNDVIGLRPILEKIANKEMDAGVALKFAKFVREILVEIQNFETKRAELFQKYGKAEGEGDQQVVKIIPKNEKKFNAAIKRALNKELKVKPFPIATLGIEISASDLVNALALFK